MTLLPKFEQLEDRIVLDGVPEVTIELPNHEGDVVDIGEQNVAVTLTFDNVGPDSGYVPYIDFVLPATGEDGDDGVTLDSASFLGSSITTTEITFDSNGEAVHPLATDAAGDPLIVSAADFGAQAGDTLVVFELPYGSFSPGNPPVDIDVVLDFSPLADLSENLGISAVGGFAYGCDPLNNPGTDAPIRAAAPTTVDVSQRLFNVFKESSIPEDEAANGPSYPYTYTFGVDVADGQSLDNFSLIDNLPHKIVYLGGLSFSGGTGGTVVSEPAVGAPITGANDQIQIDFSQVTGTVSVSFDFYVTDEDFDTGDSVITPGSGTPGGVTNAVEGAGEWTPLDPRDGPVPVADSATTTDEVAALNIQKELSLFADNNASVTGVSPGDEYEFTLNIQVSDYFNMGDLVVEDLLGNGWEFVTGSATFTTVEEVGAITTAQNFGRNLDVNLSDFNTGGTTGLTFDLSQAMIDAGQDGFLTGDAARPGAITETQTTMTITYRAIIRESYTDTGGLGQANIGQGDIISNKVDVIGQVYDNTTGAPTGSTLTDDSEAEVELARGEIREKSVASVNGQPFDPLVPIAAGDEVTFSIIYDSPLGSFDSLVLTDNLPQNVFDALEVTTFYEPGTGPAVPPAGQATFGPADTFYTNLSTPSVPAMTSNGPDNQIDFDLSNLNVNPRQPVVVEILVTVTVQDALFAPELLLTNQVTAFENNEAFGETDTTAIARFVYAQPELNISKGVVAFSPNPNSDVTLGATGPVTFNDPGTSGARFTGQINSSNLDSSPIDANISGIDAGDAVTFAIVVENTGRAPNGAFDVVIQDSLPAGFSPVGGNGNVFVTDGNGDPIAFTGDLFAGGITLTDPPPVGGLAEGAIAGFDPTAGDNVIIVTYDAAPDPTVVPAQSLTNTAGVTNFAAFEGGADRVPGDNLTDTAQASIDTPEMEKSLKSRQFSADGSITGRDPDEVVVGEVVEFTIRVDIPEASYFDAELRDRVNAGGLVLESAIIDASPVVGQVGTTATLTGGEIVFDLGDFVNPGDNDLTNDFIEVTVQARVDDAANFNAGDLLRNIASFEYSTANGGPSQTLQDDETLHLTEPELTLDKQVSLDVVEAGETVDYTIDIENLTGSRDAPAFDLTLSDTLPSPEMALDAVSIELYIDNALVAFDGVNFDLTVTGNSFDLFIDRLDPGQNAEIRYSADVLQNINAGRELQNTADLVFDTTPEDDSASDGDDREYSLSDTETIQTRAPGIDKIVDTSATSYAETTGTDIGIGELVTYEITVDIPEGEVDDVILTDTLPAGLEYVSSTIVRIGDAGNRITGSNIGPGQLEPGVAGNNSGQTTTFDFGDIENAYDGVTDGDDQIVVRITARLTADAGVDSSDVLTNTSALQYTDGQGSTQTVEDTADIDVVEPVMELTKDVSPITADAGETVSYTLVATNSGDGPAYDMVIDDDIVGSAVAADQASVVITLRDDLGAVYTPAEAPGFSFNAAGELSVIVPTLPSGYLVEITYDAVVQDSALFATTYVNTAEVTRYDSNPEGDTTTPPTDPDAEERVYDNTLAGHVIPQATASFSTPDVTLDKSYLSSSDANTADAGANNAELVVGETVTYLLTITIPEGQADLTLTDVMPTGLQAQSAEVISLDGASSTTLAAGDTQANANITLLPGSVAFDFGTVSLPGSVDAAASDTEITVSVTALVTDTLPQVADGNTLTNTATLEVTDPVDGTALQPDVTASENVDIVEPELVIDKTGPVGADPGDAVPYQITVTNTGTAPAYDAVISDPIADVYLSLVGGSISVTHSGGTIIPPGDITENAFAGDGFTIENLTLLPGESVTVDFSILLDLAAPEANSFINTSTVEYDTVDDGDPSSPTGRTGTDDDDHSLATVPRIVKTPFSSSYGETNSDDPGDTPFDLAIGEEVTYRYVITLPEIEMESLFIEDTLPDGFEYVSYSIGSTGNISGASLSSPDVDNTGPPNVVFFDFGALDNTNTIDGINANDDIVLFVTAVVTDDGANTAGAERTNMVTLDVDPAGPTDPFDQQVTEADVRIVEPELDIDKTGPIALNPGDSGTYTIVVENSGPSVTPPATGPAYDVTISDVLDPEMTLDAGPITVLLNGNPTTPDSITRGPGGFTLGFDVLDANDVLTITYSATLDAAAVPLDSFVNTATANYDSTPGTPTDPDHERSYAPESDNHVLGTLAELTKTPVSSNVSETGDTQNTAGIVDLAIGEEVTYELVLTLPDIEMDLVELVDTLPPGLEFVSARLVGTSDDVTINGTTTITPSTGGATFEITDVVNDTSGTDLNEITLEVVARVRDVIANVDTVQLTNAAGLTITPEGGTPLNTVTDTAVVEVVEPELTLDKTGNIAVNPGDPVNYTIEITNTGTGPAYDVIVEDALSNALLSLVSGTVAIDLGGDITASVDVTETATGFIFELDDNATGDPIPLLPGETLTVTYTATLDPSAPSARSFVNTATAEYDTLPGDPVDAAGNPIDDRDYSVDNVYSVATVPFLVKTPTASSFAETSETPFELAIGETVTYTYELYLPEIELSDVSFFDDLPDGMEYLSHTIVSNGDMTAIGGGPFPAPTVTLTGNDLTLEFQNIDNPEDTFPPTIGTDDIITITVSAIVTDAVSAGDALTNEAVLQVTPNGGPPLNQAQTTATVDVVEPELNLDKTGPLGANPGDTVPFTITVANQHPSGATGPAYDVSITDSLPPEFSLDTGSITFTSDLRGTLVPVTLNASTTGFDAAFSELLADEILTISYSADLIATPPLAGSFENTVTVDYDSAPGPNPEEKDYAPVTDEHRVGTSPGLTKTVVDTDIAETGSAEHDPNNEDVTVGELITYELVITLPEFDNQSVSLVDNLPSGLEFVSSEITGVGAEITGVSLGDTTLATANGQRVSFNFGPISNAYAEGQVNEGVIDADDQITIEVVVRVADVPAAIDGAVLTNDARLNVTMSDGSTLDEQIAQDSVDVVEPQIDIQKSVSDPKPMVGDIITYTVVLSNDATATGPAFNLVISDNLPFELSLSATPVLSDPTLGNVMTGPGARNVAVSVPVLQPGETVTLTYEVFVGYSSPVLSNLINTATVTGGTTPDGTGRPIVDSDIALIQADPAPAPVEEREERLINSGVDDAQFLPILLIDPIFSGTAEPGSNVTVTLYRQDGSLSYVRNIVADAGGHWIAIFPSVELDNVQDEGSEFFNRSVLFDAPYRPLDNIQRDSIGTPILQRSVTTGTLLNDEGYSITLRQDRPSTLPQGAGEHNARTFFNPAVVGEGFGTNVQLKVNEVFENVAGLTVERLLQASEDPLGESLNRFNYEFLSESTALPGSAR